MAVTSTKSDLAKIARILSQHVHHPVKWIDDKYWGASINHVSGHLAYVFGLGGWYSDVNQGDVSYRAYDLSEIDGSRVAYEVATKRLVPWSEIGITCMEPAIYVHPSTNRPALTET